MLQIFKGKSVKGGVLLYALVISVILGLLLQFALQCEMASKRQQIEQKDRLQAQLMVDLVAKKCTQAGGKFDFDQGQVTYHRANSQMQYDVTLSDGTEIQLIQ